MVLTRKLGEDSLCVASDVLRAGIERVGLRDLDSSQLPGPRVEPTKDAAMKRLPMR